jgi:hypothetical protein
MAKFPVAMRRPSAAEGSDVLTMPSHAKIKASTLRTILTQARIERGKSVEVSPMRELGVGAGVEITPS